MDIEDEVMEAFKEEYPGKITHRKNEETKDYKKFKNQYLQKKHELDSSLQEIESDLKGLGVYTNREIFDALVVSETCRFLEKKLKIHDEDLDDLVRSKKKEIDGNEKGGLVSPLQYLISIANDHSLTIPFDEIKEDIYIFNGNYRFLNEVVPIEQTTFKQEEKEFVSAKDISKMIWMHHHLKFLFFLMHEEMEFKVPLEKHPRKEEIMNTLKEINDKYKFIR